VTKAAVICAVWTVTFLLLLAVGGLLSWATLRVARRAPSERSGRAQGGDALLRRVYRAVLWLSCAFYYASIPLVALVVLVAGSGLIYLCFRIGHVPIKLVLLLAVGIFATLVSIAKSLFVRGEDGDPGLRLDLATEPRLRALLEEVAARIGTRPVDSVYLTPGTDLAVFERGGMLRQLRGATERCLILGVGVLDGLELGPFKAILAHEYGHFSNQDTAGGGFALAVRRSIVTLAHHLAAAGAATWYNPAWWFVNGFHRVFLRISQGASRLQEVLADRWAAFTYGAAAFERGLRHVIERSVFFQAHANAALRAAVQSRFPVANLYEFNPAELAGRDDLSQEIAAALHCEPSPYDSHPAPLDRFAWVQALAGSVESAPEDGSEVWCLFQDRTGIEGTMTRAVCATLERQGVVFLKPEEEGSPAEETVAAAV
jgi:Zn-dependent protease with chaperone function